MATAEAEAVETPPAEARGGWVLVWALSLGQLVSWGSIFYGFSLFVVPMEKELGWDRTWLTGALAVGLLVSGLFAYPVGAWIDRHGGRFVMTAGSLFAAALLALWAAVADLAVFYAIWVGLGFAMAATLYEPAFAVLTRGFPHSYRLRITAMTLVGGFASTVFIPLTQLFIDTLGWRSALVALALCNAALCLPIHFFLLTDRGASPGTTASPAAQAAVSDAAVRRALRHPVFWGLAVCFTAYYSTFTVLTFHLVPLLTERNMPSPTILIAYALIGPAQVLGRIVVLALGKRLSTPALGRAVVLFFPVSVLLLIGFPSSVAALFCFALLYGGGNGVMTILRGTAIPDLLWREGYGAVNGALSMPANIARAIAPFAAALIWRGFGGYDAVLWTIIAGSLVAAAGFWFAAGAAAPHRR